MTLFGAKLNFEEANKNKDLQVHFKLREWGLDHAAILRYGRTRFKILHARELKPFQLGPLMNY